MKKRKPWIEVPGNDPNAFHAAPLSGFEKQVLWAVMFGALEHRPTKPPSDVRIPTLGGVDVDEIMIYLMRRGFLDGDLRITDKGRAWL